MAMQFKLQRHDASASHAVRLEQQLCFAHIAQAVSPGIGEHAPPELELDVEVVPRHTAEHGPCEHWVMACVAASGCPHIP
jgi:hypothetical protein